MKDSKDKYIGILVEKMMKEVSLDKTSFDFTSKVMSKVLVTKPTYLTVYKPLISKTVLILIFVCIIILFTYIMSNGNNTTSGWMNTLNWSQFYNNHLFFRFKFSKISLYAIVLATLMLFLQISLLKNYFRQQEEL